MRTKDIAIIKRCLKVNNVAYVNGFNDGILYGNSYYFMWMNENTNDFKKTNLNVCDKIAKTWQEQWDCETDVISVNINDLKEHIKFDKMQRKPSPFIINTKYGKIGVNAKYLADALEFCKTDIVKFNCTDFPYKQPLWIAAEDSTRFATVLPVYLR
jgi:hypothetical protein